MPKTVPMIGVHPEELCWMRLLISLLRHADSRVPELVRQALLYVAEASGECAMDPSGSRPSTAEGSSRSRKALPT
jgi:hypothetical protein